MKDNKLIAEFMGYKTGTDECGDYIECHEGGLVLGFVPDYDKDWNLIIPVVEKIDGMANIVSGRDWVEVIAPTSGEIKYIKNYSGNRLRSTYKAVVEFIKWYNENS